MKKIYSQRAGFGLLEVMFSTGIFVMVVGSLVLLGRLSTRNAVLSTHRTQAVNLAQDGIEAVRQMRDTAWIRNSVPAGSAPEKDWLTFPTCTSDSFNKPIYIKDGVAAYTSSDKPEYEICYDNTNFTPGQFGLKLLDGRESPTGVTPDTNLFITLKNGTVIDPGEPLYYKRTVHFETVPDSSPASPCPAPANVRYQGLQLLSTDGSGSLCTIASAERDQVIKVVVTVTWKDFNQDFSVSLNTLLTNWRNR